MRIRRNLLLSVAAIAALVMSACVAETEAPPEELCEGAACVEVTTPGDTAAQDDTDPEDIVEWAAFGFIFVIASLSFHDGRPRGMSGLDFEKEDQFNVADFLEGLTYRRDGLRFHGDYIRGRSLKTEIIVRINGTVAISTWGRGESLYRWLDLMKGKKTLRAVTGVDDQ